MEAKITCKLCGSPIPWKGMGRKPKYCKQCDKEMHRLQALNSYHKRKLYRNKLTKRDMYLLAIQKRAS